MRWLAQVYIGRQAWLRGHRGEVAHRFVHSQSWINLELSLKLLPELLDNRLLARLPLFHKDLHLIVSRLALFNERFQVVISLFISLSEGLCPVLLLHKALLPFKDLMLSDLPAISLPLGLSLGCRRQFDETVFRPLPFVLGFFFLPE